MSGPSPRGALIWGLLFLLVIGAAGCGNRGSESMPIADPGAHDEDVRSAVNTSSAVLRVEGMT